MMPAGANLADALGRDVVPHDLAIDVLLAHAAGDQLGVLRAEVEDQDFFVGDQSGFDRHSLWQWFASRWLTPELGAGPFRKSAIFFFTTPQENEKPVHKTGQQAGDYKDLRVQGLVPKPWSA